MSYPTVPGQLATWAGAISGTAVVAGAEAAAQLPAAPGHTVGYLYLLGVSGIITTVAKLVMDDRRHARESGFKGLQDQHNADVSTIDSLRSEIGRLREDLDSAHGRIAHLADRFAPHPPAAPPEAFDDPDTAD